MQALVYLGPSKKNLIDRPEPTLEKATDAIVKITKTTICGTDLHVLGGDVVEPAHCSPIASCDGDAAAAPSSASRLMFRYRITRRLIGLPRNATRP